MEGRIILKYKRNILYRIKAIMTLFITIVGSYTLQHTSQKQKALNLFYISKHTKANG